MKRLKNNLKRLQSTMILADLDRKNVLLAGPRQVGKTTLSKMLVSQYDSLNYNYVLQALAAFSS